MSERLERLLRQYVDAGEKLAAEVAAEFPVGSKCCMTRAEGRQRIYGTIHGSPHSWDPTRMTVKTDKRGTVLGANFHDVQILGGAR